jgi:hypothetical protein
MLDRRAYVEAFLAAHARLHRPQWSFARRRTVCRCGRDLPCQDLIAIPPLTSAGIAVASVPRAVMDAARKCNNEDSVRRLISDVVLRRLCTPQQLREELSAGPTQHSAKIRKVLRSLP